MPYHRAMALASLPAKSSGGSPFRVGGWPGGVGAGGLWVMRPGAAGHGHIRASYPAPEPGGARWKVPEGAVVGLVLAPGRARRRVFRAAGTGARWVGGRADPQHVAAVSVPGGRGRGRVRRRSTPACPVGMSSSVPAFLSPRGRSRWPR